MDEKIKPAKIKFEDDFNSSSEKQSNDEFKGRKTSPAMKRLNTQIVRSDPVSPLTPNLVAAKELKKQNDDPSFKMRSQLMYNKD